MSAVDRAPRRAHGAAGAELGDEPPRQAAGKRSRSEEAAEEDAPSTELEAEEAGDRGTEEPGTSEHAGDWDLSFELLSALGLQSVEGDPEKGDKAENEATNEATNEAKHDRGLEPGRRKATAAAWANREEPAGDDTAIARAGFTGSAASSFPHREAIERSFGAPLPATAFLGGAAAEASAALGAEGYALGDQVGFASTAPSLELAAHEAAHVMQATSGVQRHGGEGVYEDHADAVAARVVRGESAADLLAAGPVAAPAVRRGKQSRRQRRLRQILQAQREQERQRQAQQALRRKVRSLRSSLVRLIRRAEWKEIRKDAYPAESRDGIERAKQRQRGQLPDLTGLGSQLVLVSFASAIKDIQRVWAARSPARRLSLLGNAINNELRSAEVPRFLGVETEGGEFKGSFVSSQWKMFLSEATLNAGTLSNPDASELCNTLLHEARHAEQSFLAARYAAGPALRMRADQIADEQGIPLQIARAAVVARFLPGTDAQVRALGEAMYDANVTNGEANQAISDDHGLPEMETARSAAIRAFRDLRAAVTAQSIRAALLARQQLRRAIAVVEQRYTDYRNLPYEADAHEVGDAVGLAFDELG